MANKKVEITRYEIKVSIIAIIDERTSIVKKTKTVASVGDLKTAEQLLQKVETFVSDTERRT